MDLGIAGKVVFFTGGSKGMGRIAAKMLAAEGCPVAIVARGKGPVDDAVSEITTGGGIAIGVTADISQPDQVTAAVERVTRELGAPQIVVGQTLFTTWLRTGPAPRRSACSRRWPTSTRSTASRSTPSPPGWIETENAIAYLDRQAGLASPEERRRWMKDHARVPAARMGRPDEIASMIVYLCSELAGYVNGAWIEVDGAHHRSAF